MAASLLVWWTSKLSRQSNGRSNLEVVGLIPTEVKRIFSLPRVVP